MQVRRRRHVAAVVVALVAQVLVATTGLAPALGETAAPVERLWGDDRIETAIAVSIEQFPNGADGAVIARADDFADALAGAPLAAEVHGPLLLTAGGALDERVADELRRVLPPGATVTILGGTQAMSATLDAGIQSHGFAVERVFGVDRYSTAVAIAEKLQPESLIVATGRNFPDALAASAAATHRFGAVLLTDGATMPATTRDYIDAHSQLSRHALGGPAAVADPEATGLVGETRYETARIAAQVLFEAPSIVGVATGAGFADALAGGVHAGRLGAPLLLSPPGGAPDAAVDFVAGTELVVSAVVYGGSHVVTESAASIIGEAVAADDPDALLKVTSPNGGECLGAGTLERVGWLNDASAGESVRVELLNRGNVVTSVVVPMGDGTGSSDIELPTDLGKDFVVRLISDIGAIDLSDLPFCLQDVMPPRLKSFGLSPTSVDTSAAPASVQVTLTFTDDLSGVGEGTGFFRGPNGQTAYFGFGELLPLQGVLTEATYETTVKLPKGSEQGVWSLGYVIVSDHVDNGESFSGVGIGQAGFATSFVQTGQGDTLAPKVVSLDMPTSFDTSNGDVELSFALSVEDEMSGFDRATLWLEGPTTRNGGAVSFEAPDPVANGSFNATLTVPGGSAQGTWRIARLDLQDAAGNYHELYPQMLRRLGVRTEFEQTGAGDGEPPLLRSLDIAPRLVTTSGAPAVVTVSMHIEDGMSGMQGGWGLLRSPKGQEVRFYFGRDNLVEGTTSNGTFTTTATIPAFSEWGTWRVAWLELADEAGNDTTVSYEGLVTAGFEATFDNTEASTPPDADVDGPTITAFSASTRVTDTSTGEATVAFTATVDDPSGVEGVSISLRTHLSRYDGSVTLMSAGGSLFHGELTIPAGDPSATWWFTDLRAFDSAGNGTFLQTGDLHLLQWPYAVHNTGPVDADSTAPFLVDLSVAPGEIDSSSGNGTVSVRARVTDVSGVASVQAYLRGGPGGLHPSSTLTLVSGSSTDGTYEGDIVVPAGSTVGTYEIQVSVGDIKRNSTTYAGTDLDHLGFPFEVTDAGAAECETDAPRIENFQIEPQVIDTTAQAQEVIVRLRLTDASGAKNAWVYTQTPSGDHGPYATLELVSGSPSDGVWEGKISLPHGAEEGIYRIPHVQLADAVGNDVSIPAGDLDMRGFPTYFKNRSG